MRLNQNIRKGYFILQVGARAALRTIVLIGPDVKSGPVVKAAPLDAGHVIRRRVVAEQIPLVCRTEK